ncbi:MAG TPA: NUDIX hydrolase [Chloroflexota bacterium]
MGRDNRAWQRLSSTLLLDRRPWFRIFGDRVRLPSGKEIDGFLRIDSRSYAVIFAVTDDEHVLFVEGYKYGPDRVILQLPAGYLEAGEAPEVCARRELLEETGYTARDWEFLGAYCPDGNRGFGTAHFFLARGAEPFASAVLDDEEALVVRAVPLNRVREVLVGSELGELTAVAGIGLALARLEVSGPG